ncbi:patatin-like phospholipase family protein [Clostridium sp. 'deep sea']|uniref:patatin-like phospholipase family protein n=1 Tax=Clostridium sp. 'deep sea' TaxID=2779445 RepID=UPI001896834F|nr:patatin-like phospholipase family protein [Clostridium sp. 'deep sea']QOR33713.1 patatin-like phospholipase family protein [Clostridium sp. 'deep sea']
MSRETPLLTDKKLWQAMRSSMALPVAFSPMEFAPWLLTDGGVKENLPVDLAAELGATSALVVDVSPPMPPLKHDNFMHIGLRALDIIGQESNDWTTKIKVDIIQPNVAKINTLDFNKLDEAIAAGYKAGYDYLKQHDMSKKG